MGDQEQEAPSEKSEAPGGEETANPENELTPEPAQTTKEPKPGAPAEEAKPEEDKEEARPSEASAVPPEEGTAEKRPSQPDTDTKPKESETAETKEHAEAVDKVASKEKEPKPEERKSTASKIGEDEEVKEQKSPSLVEKTQSVHSRASKVSKTSRTSQELHEIKSEEIVKTSALVSSESFEKRRGLTKEDGKEGRKSRTERLSSRAQKVLGSTISIRRLSVIGDFYDRSKGARYMNTYKLESDNPFKPEKVTKILEAVMTEALENLTYDPEKCPKQAKWASSAIRAKVKELQFERYKLICLVTIGEKNSQDVFVTCRFLWDVDRDRYATYSLENTFVFGIAQCFGVYYE
ncbi:hepatoma-derived growth factor-related protein 2-like [Tribolium madens]|uniref:hepatoma-derived growth factor-related protein 2-like n=1 Tax=Tribolium madens TaxID=41895 RepID=UPI001CF75C38|nr:hepatoma-derived growth factor-related protein 2-like [Tribolium madens]